MSCMSCAQVLQRANACLSAVHAMQGIQLPSDVRDIRLHAGDLLLLDAGSSFEHRYQNDTVQGASL